MRLARRATVAALAQVSVAESPMLTAERRAALVAEVAALRQSRQALELKAEEASTEEDQESYQVALQHTDLLIAQCEAELDGTGEVPL